MNWADRRYAIGRGIAAVRAKTGSTDTYYIYSCINHYLDRLLALTSGSVFPSLSTDDFNSFKIPWPDDNHRRAIVQILRSLDDKIELNRRMNRTLEKIAAAIFKSWFIDFDPVRRNAARARNQPSPPAPLPAGEGRVTGHYRGGYDFAGLVETARALRKQQTPAEAMFWELVRDRRFMDLKFSRQHQVGDYVVDFYCHEHRLVIEFDGGIHATRQTKDQKRDAWMQSQNFTVLRFPNQQLLDDPESVLNAIAQTVEPHPDFFPLPLEEGDGAVAELPSPLGRRAGDEGSVEELDRLFPDSFEDSALGPIPKGWKAGKLGDVAENPRRTVQPSDVPPATPYIGLQHMPRCCIALDAWGRADEVGSGKSQFKEGEFLFGKLRPYFHKVGIAPVDGVCSTDIVVVTPKAAHWHGYVISLVSSKAFVDYTDSHSAGTKMPRTNWKDMARYPLALPPEPLARAFQGHVASLYDRITLNVRQCRRLAALRDTLLPKLLSGEIELPEAEERVEGVT
jgi:very-short-patch-repair endonuclease/restriction endonuclease S subunit